jgi:IS5 family transposase
VQTRQRLAGITSAGASRRVSLLAGDARPTAKGRLGKPVEFGYKGQVIDTKDSVVLDDILEQGNPNDAPPLAPPVGWITTPHTWRRPRIVTADRGYGGNALRITCTAGASAPWSSLARDDPARPLGRRAPGRVPPHHQMADPQRRPDQHPQTRLRLGPTCLDGIEGAGIWTGHGILAHNLIKIGTLAS